MKRLLLWAIRMYQRWVSLDTGMFRWVMPFGSVCRFQPTCSQYMYDAVDRYGIIHGTLLGLRRILRCHPWGKSGPDPVP